MSILLRCSLFILLLSGFISTSSALQQYSNGTIVKGSGDKVFIIVGGNASWIPNPNIFNALGLNWANIKTIPDTQLNAIPKSPLLIKGDSDKVYLVKGSSRQWITSPEAFTQMGLNWNTLLVIKDSQLAQIPLGESISTSHSYPSRQSPESNTHRQSPDSNTHRRSPEARVASNFKAGPNTVKFENYGLAAYEVFKLGANGNEIYWGMIPAKTTTPAIPVDSGEIWRFKLAASARSNDSVRDTYQTTSQRTQFHSLPGFMNNAKDPAPNVILREFRNLKSTIDQTWVSAVGISLDELERRVPDLIREHESKIRVIANHMNSFIKNNAGLESQIRSAFEDKDSQRFKQIFNAYELRNQLDRLILGHNSPAAPALLDDSSMFTNANYVSYDNSSNAYYSLAQASGSSYVITLAGVGDGSIFVGASAEFGMGWDINGDPDPAPDWFYTGASGSFGAAAGIDFSPEVGVWFVPKNKIAGHAWGATIGFSFYGGVGLTFWFDEKLNFLGFNVNPSIGFSAEVEGARGFTALFPERPERYSN